MRMQGLGYAVSIVQLTRARSKCDPGREKRPTVPNLVPTDEMRVLIRAERALPNAQLRVADDERRAAQRADPHRLACAHARMCAIASAQGRVWLRACVFRVF